MNTDLAKRVHDLQRRVRVIRPERRVALVASVDDRGWVTPLPQRTLADTRRVIARLDRAQRLELVRRVVRLERRLAAAERREANALIAGVDPSYSPLREALKRVSTKIRSHNGGEFNPLGDFAYASETDRDNHTCTKRCGPNALGQVMHSSW